MILFPWIFLFFSDLELRFNEHQIGIRSDTNSYEKQDILDFTEMEEFNVPFSIKIWKPDLKNDRPRRITQTFVSKYWVHHSLSRIYLLLARDVENHNQMCVSFSTSALPSKIFKINVNFSLCARKNPWILDIENLPQTIGPKC